MSAPSVLVVEDSPLIATLIQALLHPAGLPVVVARDAEMALDILERLTPALILMDVQLPGMSGLDLTRLLKTNPSRCKIPIVALTASKSSVERQAITDAGCDGFIAKPIDPARFAGRIRDFANGTEQPPPVRARISKYGQLRKAFLSEGALESRALVEVMEQGRQDKAFIDKVLHRWVGCGDAAGIPEISTRAGELRELIPGQGPDRTALELAKALNRLFDDALAGCAA